MLKLMGKKIFYAQKFCLSNPVQDIFQQFWEKAPGHNWEKMIDLTSKLGKIHDIEHNKGGKYSHEIMF